MKCKCICTTKWLKLTILPILFCLLGAGIPEESIDSEKRGEDQLYTPSNNTSPVIQHQGVVERPSFLYIKLKQPLPATVTTGYAVPVDTLDKNLKELATLLRQLGVNRLTPVLPPNLQSTAAIKKTLASFNRKRVPSPPAPDEMQRLFRIKPKNLEEASSKLNQSNLIEYAERPIKVELFAPTNDQFYNSTDAWGHYSTNAEQAWNLAQGTGSVIAILDTGVATNHPDLAGNLFSIPGEIQGNQLDDDGNGQVDDVNGWNFSDSNSSTDDDHGHGTHVAGIANAVGNNNSGIAGIAYGAKFLPIKLNFNTYPDLAGAILYATASGADVINNSWGGRGISQALQDAIEFSIDMGVVVVNAAGNSTQNTCGFTPTNIERAISVGAIDSSHLATTYSNYGRKIDVVAPGGNSSDLILSTIPDSSSPIIDQIPPRTGAGGGTYLEATGTSVAAPFVSGVAALLIEKNPTWTARQVMQSMRNTATDIGTNGRDIQYGAGLLNAQLAVNHGAIPPPVSAIDKPRNCETVGRSPVPVYGTASSSTFTHYELQIGIGESPTTFSTIASSTTQVVDGLLGTWTPTAQQAQGEYTLRVLTYGSDGNGITQSEDSNSFYLEPNLSPSLSFDIPTTQRVIQSSPKIVDLDNDGSKELVIGTAVFNSNGSVRPGWDGDPGMSRSTPAIFDVDGDGKLEVFAIEHHCLSFIPNCPDQTGNYANHGGPALFAWRADRNAAPQGSNLWSRDLGPSAGNNPYTIQGWPSSVSAGDVDGDGAIELVFTVYWGYNNLAKETTLFVIDALTGSLETRRTIAGANFASVALADFDSDGIEDIVLSTKANYLYGQIRPSHVWAIHGDGSDLTNWPIVVPIDFSEGLGYSDPMLSDVDNDGEYELIVNRHMWNNNGTFVPAPFPAPSGMPPHQGIVHQFQAYSESDLTGSGQYFFNLPEPLRGANTLAVEIDGSGILSDIMSSRNLRGYSNLRPKLYASLPPFSSNPTPYTTFTAPHSELLITSTPTVGDLDGDGNNELIAIAGNKVVSWSVAGPIAQPTGAWTMFQHDLLNTGRLPKKTESNPKGLTWQKTDQHLSTGTVTIGCGYNGSNRCNPYQGDHSCERHLPLMCINKSSAFPAPRDIDNSIYYRKWSSGVIATTTPVSPTHDNIQTLAQADDICADQFGSDWVVAEHHDGWGWGLQAYGNTSALSDRYWMNINNQTDGNCWTQ